MSNAFVVLAYRIDNTQRHLIHQTVKAVAEDWWHEFPDVWIVVGGDKASEWRNRLEVFTPTAPSGLLVLRLDGSEWESERNGWASLLPSSMTRWFHFGDLAAQQIAAQKQAAD